MGTIKDQSPIKSVKGREIATIPRLLLFVHAGGRCEFDGCNKYLLEHPLTLTSGNFAQVAHVVAFSVAGPRGKTSFRPANINDVSNLMLLCPQCHKLIDDHPERYSRSILEEQKHQHEDRIKHLTGLGPELRTTIFQLKAKIGGQSVDIPVSQVADAVYPRYPDDKKGFVIDLTSFGEESPAFFQLASEEIKRRIDSLYAPGMNADRTRHISLFALAPIPLLIFLGKQLSNKIAVDPYQRHRDTEDWVWKTSGEPVTYRFNRLRYGTDISKVALVLSLSGVIHLNDLPAEINDRFYVYEITLGIPSPNPTFLKTREALTEFKNIYQLSLRSIMRDHGTELRAIELFPAVPAPVAIICGRELLPKVDPALKIYDFDKAKGGFIFKLEVK
ncbi:MAG: SAVED domain-containing protein [Thermodesulfobacteriota bacterium]|jgi:hypothetical protein|nr:MAG: SAVED domain-containing protein [Thermodesulfobacteriota bacterium]